MGLDMYVYSVPEEMLGSDETGVFPEIYDEEHNFKPEVNSDFWYWRKFYTLHGWLRNLYLRKGGTEEFNCTKVRLRQEDLKELEENLPLLELGPREFGSAKKFISACRVEFSSGRAILYFPWY